VLFRRILPLLLLARTATAQVTDTARPVPSARVSGVVYDSIAQAPLAGAIVQLVAADDPASFSRTTSSDSRGRFAFDPVPDGRYTLGFFHPMLDSLGIESPERDLVVRGERSVSADLAIPSAERIQSAVCGAGKQNGVVLGYVRDAASRAPLAGVAVSVTWVELVMSTRRLERRTPRLAATTSERGWFALCGTPRPGTIAIIANRGADSTDMIEVEMPADGFMRRELYLGRARWVAGADTASRRDTLASPPRLLHAGAGRLSGTVVNSVDGQPVAGARVGIANGPQARANERGEWTIADAPAGTRVLEVRGVGFYPVRIPVHVLDDAAPVRVALSTTESVLDTVKVNATRMMDRQRAGFEDRRRRGQGHYLTAEDVARRQPVVTSDLFRMMPGVRVDGRANVTVRGGLGWCAPALYLDGNYMEQLSAGDIDTWVQPSEIIGVEVYTDISAPPEFQSRANGCGSIVVWTNLDQTGKQPLSKKRLLVGLTVTLLGVLLAVLMGRR
jgi:carboxypeptidase family protein